MKTCEICDKEINKLSQCRKCNNKVCPNCIIGLQCVDCVRDENEEDVRPSKFNHKDY